MYIIYKIFTSYVQLFTWDVPIRRLGIGADQGIFKLISISYIEPDPILCFTSAVTQVFTREAFIHRMQQVQPSSSLLHAAELQVCALVRHTFRIQYSMTQVGGKKNLTGTSLLFTSHLNVAFVHFNFVAVVYTVLCLWMCDAV